MGFVLNSFFIWLVVRVLRIRNKLSWFVLCLLVYDLRAKGKKISNRHGLCVRQVDGSHACVRHHNTQPNLERNTLRKDSHNAAVLQLSFLSMLLSDAFDRLGRQLCGPDITTVEPVWSIHQEHGPRGQVLSQEKSHRAVSPVIERPLPWLQPLDPSHSQREMTRVL